ncbi:MAG: hypothetical protein GKR91_17285 [Pseudomonadales bacterium]|nr:hypothetical protein [Pseudomonadales bacterium]
MIVASFLTKLSRFVVCLGLSVLLLSHSLSAQQNDFFNPVDVDVDANSNNEPFSLIGWVTQEVAKGLESPGVNFSRQDNDFTKVETALFAQFDARLNEGTNFRFSAQTFHDQVYRIEDDIDFSRAESRELRNRFQLKDFYVERDYGNGLYFKVGNQIIAWGMSEYLRVTDLVNTEQLYRVAQQDLEDLRNQVPAALLTYSSGDWVFDGVLTYAAGANDISPEGDDFDPFIVDRSLGHLVDEVDADTEHEMFFRASSRYSQGDMQFVIAEFNDNELTVTEMAALRSVNPQIRYTQNRMRAVGMAANWVEGDWLLFGELGLHKDKAVRPSADAFFARTAGWDQKDQVLSVAGIEYSGYRNLLLTLELNNIRTRDHDQFMYWDENVTSFGLRAYWTAMNERLQLLGVWNELADDAGEVGRLSVNYNYSDNLDLGLLWVEYASDDDSILYEYRNNDVLQLQLRYNFQL